MNIVQNVDYQKQEVIVGCDNCMIVGYLNPKTSKLHINLFRTLKWYLFACMLTFLEAGIIMSILAFIGLLVSLPLRLFGVDIASLTGWFFDSFRFLSNANLVAGGIMPLVSLLTRTVVMFVTYLKSKKYHEKQLKDVANSRTQKTQNRKQES